MYILRVYIFFKLTIVYTYIILSYVCKVIMWGFLHMFFNTGHIVSIPQILDDVFMSVGKMGSKIRAGQGISKQKTGFLVFSTSNVHIYF